VCTQRKKGEAKSQGILNVGTFYICEEPRLTLPNMDTSSTGWAAPVIALSCTLSTHHHPFLPNTTSYYTIIQAIFYSSFSFKSFQTKLTSFSTSCTIHQQEK
jgi:hypothetical protein